MDTAHIGLLVTLVVLLVLVGVLWFRLREVARNEQQFRRLTNTAHDMIWIINPHGRFLYVNGAIERMLGLKPEELLGKPLDKITCERSATACYNELRHMMSTGELRFPRTELKYRRSDGTTFWVELAINVERDKQGRIRAVYGFSRDVDEQHQARQRMYHMAHHDPLTNLPNRVLFFDRLEAALSRARRQSWRVAVIYMDLDDFKEINDAFGHGEGDEVLCLIASRLSAVMRREDTVARIGGDEFAAIVEDIQDPAVITGLRNKLMDAVIAPITTEQGHQHTQSISMGVALVGDFDGAISPDLETEKILTLADRDMYQHKRHFKENGRRKQPVMDVEP